MAEKSRTEINAELLEELRRQAEEQGRSATELLNEIVGSYLEAISRFQEQAALAQRGFQAQAELAQRLAQLQVDSALKAIRLQADFAGASRKRPGSLQELFERVDRGQRERGVEPLSEDEAMRLAVEEQHAWRQERRAAQ